jgi:6,7-dimethyl-8-ribityllumazine synthase
VSLNVAIVYGEFHADLVAAMRAAARDQVGREGGRVAHEVGVPGSYEAPLAIKHLLSDPRVDLVVLLGYIERGETLHGEVMGNVVHRAVLDLSLTYDKPVGFGVIGPGATREQAETRKEDYARAAVTAAFRSRRTLDALS